MGDKYELIARLREAQALADEIGEATARFLIGIALLDLSERPKPAKGAGGAKKAKPINTQINGNPVGPHHDGTRRRRSQVQ